MEHISASRALDLAAEAAEKQGPGNLLRVVLIVMVVGCVLAAWLLLRGYRQGNAQGSADGSRAVGDDSRAAGDGSRDGRGSDGEDRAPADADGRDA
ncbi:hypothetical protein [Streptomyces alboflavus]|uniref:hypothetical protein n=1 Tax=Streptomyces alboflavus TaxID=67267 RepID=UPI000525FF57|nr:hypothetical protein [Streptomyces alboflavus]